MTFRIGPFGLDKLHNVDRTVNYLKAALGTVGLRPKVWDGLSPSAYQICRPGASGTDEIFNRQ